MLRFCRLRRSSPRIPASHTFPRRVRRAPFIPRRFNSVVQPSQPSSPCRLLSRKSPASPPKPLSATLRPPAPNYWLRVTLTTSSHPLLRSDPAVWKTLPSVLAITRADFALKSKDPPRPTPWASPSSPGSPGRQRPEGHPLAVLFARPLPPRPWTLGLAAKPLFLLHSSESNSQALR